MPRVSGRPRQSDSTVKAARRTASPPTAAPKGRCRIEIPTSLRVVAIEARRELQVSGRVLATAPVDLVVLRERDGVAFRTHYPATAGRNLRYGFCYTLSRPAADADDTWSFDIIAQQHDGTMEQASFVVAHAAGATEAEVRSGPTVAEIALNDPLPPAIVHVERATLDPAGQLRVRGWAIALDPIAGVYVFSGADLLGEATLGLSREDIAAWRPEYPNAATSGFELSLGLAETDLQRALCVQAVAAGGHVHETVVVLEHIAQVPAAPLASAIAPSVNNRRDVRVFCDEAELSADGQLAVVGWAISATGISSVSVSLDGEALGEAELGLVRHDVGDEYVMIPMARHSGFRFVGRVPIVGVDERTLLLVARNGLGDTVELAVPVLRSEAPQPEPGPSADPAVAIRLQIDSPVIVEGIVSEPVSGRLTIDGWALCRSGVGRVEMHLNGRRLADAHHGLARQDVAQAFPDWPNSVRSGFAFHCPPRLLRNGAHVAEVVVIGAGGEHLARSFRFEVRKSDDDAERSPIRRRLPRVEADAYATAIAQSAMRPAFHLVLRHVGPFERVTFTATLELLREQIYLDWRLLVLLAKAGAAKAARNLLVDLAPDLIGRIDVIDRTAVAWPVSDGAAMSLFGFLSPGDVLGCDALAEITLEYARAPRAELLYADEFRVSPATGERERFYKPDFSPDLLLATNYIGRPWFATASLLDKVGATPASLVAEGEYDLILRCTEQAGAVSHVPMLLCERTAGRLDPPEAERRALASAAARRGFAAEVLPGAASESWRLRRSVPARGTVSIIIPTCGAGGYIQTCINTLRERTSYRDFEIVCIENIPEHLVERRAWLSEAADKILMTNEAFNWSRFNNMAATKARGEYLLFLNDDIEIEQPDWLDAMLEYAVQPEIGVVGARLLYPDRTVQHAGMFLAEFGVGRHAFRLATEDDPGYFGLALMPRNVTAVTGACMLMRREHFATLGGFEEAHLIVNNDVDFCLRTLEAGRRVVVTPHATLLHYEQASRGGMQDVFDRSRFAQRWRKRFALGDPFHNPNLSKHHDDFRLNEEPVRIAYGGHPLFAAEEIRRILVVKVDHIGDFILALPAIRRLKELFPAAHIDVLSSPTTASLAALEPSIDGMIPFEFFHTRSALGLKTVGKEELEALRSQLAPYRFDLAIDLRKHPETRPLLRVSGARYLAGFDYAGQFAWLDVALEWEGDRGLQPKRYHVSDDLLHLVDAVGISAATDRGALAAPTLAALRAAEPLPQALTPLFERRVACVHPGAGNEMKQWPEEHFISLIELLVTEGGVNVVLVGGPDEAEIGGRILPSLRHPTAIRSVIGELSLAGLTGLLSRCALYVGNDSGPKHIAAAVGIPTVGIHSGTVDPTEWGPMGPQAVAVARQMSCSPCYLNRLTDCVRGLVCIRQIDPAVVFAVCRRFLDGTGVLADPIPPTRSRKAPVAAGAGVTAASQPRTAPGSRRSADKDQAVSPPPRPRS